MLIETYAPNRKTAVDTTNSTSYLVVNSDGTTNANRAASVAAGKSMFPGLDPGAFAQSVTVENVTASNSFGVAWNTDSTPTNDTSTIVPGGTQFTIPGPINEIWIGKSVGTDHIVLTALF
jgi:hypothetical protein